MARRSVRLLESGYYRGDGTPTVSYRETLPRTRHHCVWYDANQYVENAHPAETETPKTRPHDTSHRTRTRTDANTTHSGSAGVVRQFFLCFLLFIGMVTMYFQLRGAQRDINTLRRLVVECQDNVGFLQGRVFFIQYGFIVKSLWDGFFFWV